MIPVIEKKLYRGPRPESYEALKVLGIKTIVSYQSGWHELFHNDFYEANSPSENGFNFIELKCSDFFPPTEHDVKRFFEVLETYPGPVYVHCLHGKDRTGFMCAVYRMQVQGWSYEDAKKELFENGFHKMPYIWWLRQLKTYEVKK